MKAQYLLLLIKIAGELQDTRVIGEYSCMFAGLQQVAHKRSLDQKIIRQQRPYVGSTQRFF